jgi:LysR family transcriptional regulator for metE and metH
VTTAFRFGGVAALLGHEIDLLITPDPIERPTLTDVPVFDYEIALAIAGDHPLGAKSISAPSDLSAETLITYPVTPERLDIFTSFWFRPAACHSVIARSKRQSCRAPISWTSERRTP